MLGANLEVTELSLISPDLSLDQYIYVVFFIHGGGWIEQTKMYIKNVHQNDGIHQSGVCLPSLKKHLRPILSCRFLEYAANERTLTG